MPGTVITASPNLTFLDSKIVADLCNTKFFIDLSPSVWITDSTTSPAFNGAENVQGAKIQITNPYGAIIKSYPASSFDIAPPMTSIYEATIPTQAGTIQYGTYTIDVQLTDENGTKYTVSKSINVCTYNKDQNPCDDRLRLVASCKNGTLTVYLSEPPLFKGVFAQTKTQSIVITYPTESGHAATNSTYSYFSVQLFEGVYKVVVNVCATYNLGDSIYLILPYAVTEEKNVKCTLDYTCIWPRIKQLNDKIDSDCSEADKTTNASIILDALRLIKTAELANDAGEDASPYIVDLEILLGCKCTCDCNGSPLVNGTPSTSIAIQGCGVSKVTVGLTDVYTIGAYTFIVDVDDVTGAITISAPAIDGCIKTQTLTFNVAAAYAAIKTRINNSTEYDFFASVIKSALTDIDASCLGLSTSQSNALTFKELIQLIITKICAGGNCDGIVTSVVVSRVGADIILTWAATGHLYVQVWVDGDFIDAKAAAITSITLPGYADGTTHTYEIKPFCANNVQGTSVGGSFDQLGCPTITAPSVSTSAALNVACPYNLTGLVLALPIGITAEWHTANNTLSSTLVPNATSVTDGIYYVFAKDSNNCYSTGVQVVVTCQTSGTCTAPQNLAVTPQFGSLLVQFQSAAFPPTGNSYTLKRRLYSDPDVDGSYTTLGSTGTGINWNSSTNRWELSDTSAIANTLYVYRAISNCGSSPYIDLTYANIVCPTITLTNTTSTITYSFVHVGGGVDKYVMQLYDSTEATLLESITELPGSPSFANPVTNTFTGTAYSPAGLPNGTYKVRAIVYIGTYSYTCSFQTKVIGNNYSNSASFNFSIDSVTGTGVPALGPTGVNAANSGHQTGISGSLTVTLTGSLVTTTKIDVYVNGGVPVACTAVTGPGVYSVGPVTALVTDNVVVAVDSGVC